MTQTSAAPPKPRLEGLDLARFLAFFGMVIVNFKIVMGAEPDGSLLSLLSGMLEGKAAATFVVLAGVGLGLSGTTARLVTLRRAVFLLAIGLLNMLIFEADILHYYAFYFLFGAFAVALSLRQLWAAILGVNLLFIAMLFLFDYDSGWDWTTLTYTGFWTPNGFMRNLFFNGWHPVIPWLGFLLLGLVLSRLPLHDRGTQSRLVIWGAIALALAEGISRALISAAGQSDPDLLAILTTAPVPPLPLYTLAGSGAACLVIGLCLIVQRHLVAWGVMGLIAPAGRQTLTLYIAHILLGMGTLEELGMIQGQTVASAVGASLLFCGAATLYAWLWSKRFKRGPVEALMRRTAG